MSLKDGTAADSPSINGKAGWAVSTNAKGKRGHRLCKGGVHHTSEGRPVSKGGVQAERELKAAEKRFDPHKEFRQRRSGFEQQEGDRGSAWGQQRKGCRQQRGGVGQQSEGSRSRGVQAAGKFELQKGRVRQ